MKQHTAGSLLEAPSIGKAWNNIVPPVGNGKPRQRHLQGAITKYINIIFPLSDESTTTVVVGTRKAIYSAFN
jgi:hypothetical protein